TCAASSAAACRGGSGAPPPGAAARRSRSSCPWRKWNGEGRPGGRPCGTRTRCGLVAGRAGGAIVDVRRAAAAREVAGACPRRPEDHRKHDADDADDQQDPADRVNVHARDGVRHREGEDGADRREKDSNSKTHVVSLSFAPLQRGCAATTEKSGSWLRVAATSKAAFV